MTPDLAALSDTDLGAAVAIEVFGYAVAIRDTSLLKDAKFAVWREEVVGHCEKLTSWFSTTYEGMGAVLERMRERCRTVRLQWNDIDLQWTVVTSSHPWATKTTMDDGPLVQADTLPRAVALAALQAVRKEGE